MAIARQLLRLQWSQQNTPAPPLPRARSAVASLLLSGRSPSSSKRKAFSKYRDVALIMLKASANSDGIVPADDEDGVSLGTMKLPPNTDIARFETLLFQVKLSNHIYLLLVHSHIIQFFTN